MVNKVRITEKHRFEIVLRYLGNRYEDISIKTGIGTKTLYKYFCKGGMLFEPYRNYEAEMNEEALRNTKGQLKRHSGQISTQRAI